VEFPGYLKQVPQSSKQTSDILSGFEPQTKKLLEILDPLSMALAKKRQTENAEKS